MMHWVYSVYLYPNFEKVTFNRPSYEYELFEVRFFSFSSNDDISSCCLVFKNCNNDTLTCYSAYTLRSIANHKKYKVYIYGRNIRNISEKYATLLFDFVTSICSAADIRNASQDITLTPQTIHIILKSLIHEFIDLPFRLKRKFKNTLDKVRNHATLFLFYNIFNILKEMDKLKQYNIARIIEVIENSNITVNSGLIVPYFKRMVEADMSQDDIEYSFASGLYITNGRVCRFLKKYSLERFNIVREELSFTSSNFAVTSASEKRKYACLITEKYNNKVVLYYFPDADLCIISREQQDGNCLLWIESQKKMTHISYSAKKANVEKFISMVLKDIDSREELTELLGEEQRIAIFDEVFYIIKKMKLTRKTKISGVISAVRFERELRKV